MKFDIHTAIQVLSQTPNTLQSIMSSFPEKWLGLNEGPDTWNVKQILQHLVFGEETDWIPRAEIILSDSPNKTFDPFNADGQFEGFEDKSAQDLLKEFTQLRQQNIEVLKSKKLDSELLEKEGIHPALGPVKLKVMLSAWVVHDLNHIAQINRVLAKQYDQEVGPWKQYLGVLQS